MKKISLLLLTLLGAGCILPAYADCNRGATQLFSCTIQKNGKRVELCDAGATIQYTFGKPGMNPEMALSVPRSQASTYQWEGFGRSMTYSVTVPNGATEYEVYSTTDKHSRSEDRAGIYVNQRGNQIAELVCVQSTVYNNMEGVKLKRNNP